MKTARAAATESATISRAGLCLIARASLPGPHRPGLVGWASPAEGYRGGFCVRPSTLCRRHPAAGYPIAVVVAERARRVLRQGVAVTLAVGRPHERGDDLEVPVGDVDGL